MDISSLGGSAIKIQAIFFAGSQHSAGSEPHVQVHLAWIKTPREKGGLGAIKIPIVADTTKVDTQCLSSVRLTVHPPAPCYL